MLGLSAQVPVLESSVGEMLLGAFSAVLGEFLSAHNSLDSKSLVGTVAKVLEDNIMAKAASGPMALISVLLMYYPVMITT